MKQKKHTQIQRILRLENIVAQMYVKLEALKLQQKSLKLLLMDLLSQSLRMV